MFKVPEELIYIRPVGIVVSDFKECCRTYDYGSQSMIYIREDLTPALAGLEFFSHLHVIYYQHRRAEWIELVEGRVEDPPLTIICAGEPGNLGIYSSRSPSRPSAMGSCVVEILKREGNRIYVKGLDALDGTPIMDIKVYVPQYDAFPSAITPLNCCMGNELANTSRHLHWDNTNVGITLGLRTGTKALQEIGINRGEAVRAEVEGGHFFAQGIEGATGCSVLRNNLIFKETNGSPGEWKLKLTGAAAAVEITLKEHSFSGASEVLTAAEDQLFASVRKSNLGQEQHLINFNR